MRGLGLISRPDAEYGASDGAKGRLRVGTGMVIGVCGPMEPEDIDIVGVGRDLCMVSYANRLEFSERPGCSQRIVPGVVKIVRHRHWWLTCIAYHSAAVSPPIAARFVAFVLRLRGLRDVGCVL